MAELEIAEICARASYDYYEYETTKPKYLYCYADLEDKEELNILYTNYRFDDDYHYKLVAEGESVLDAFFNIHYAERLIDNHLTKQYEKGE